MDFFLYKPPLWYVSVIDAHYDASVDRKRAKCTFSGLYDAGRLNEELLKAIAFASGCLLSLLTESATFHMSFNAIANVVCTFERPFRECESFPYK